MDELQNDIASGLMSLSFTTDGWKSRSAHYYLSLTVHYMTSNFQLKNLMIGLTQLEDRHTGNYIKLKFEEMMLEWNLLDVPNVPILFTTDNGANICNAIRQSSWNHIHCFAHTLQLVIKDCQKHTKGIEKLLKKARHITTHFHQSDPARRDFENAQKVSSDKTPLKLIQSVPTRWNSDYDMLERMKKLQQPLSVALSRSASVTGLSGTDWKRISDIINVLDPLNEATKISCGSKYPTISMIEPIIQGMKEALENLNFDHETNVGLNNFNDEGSDYDDNNNDEDLEISTCENESQMPMGFCEIEQDTYVIS
ncbi:zinc finger BED domain-containing protein 4-like [Bactrocera dorsalis]|uniref:Zinc finger BED domain-containing protein 4-like n=1 Tax=Bactrocera dorsalis TaxID=27457 RepID=A0ABM3J1D5_BACDO|nr:zinc finger BED domain-containing protein 4-like [Bactrocera dorsalis]